MFGTSFDDTITYAAEQKFFDSNGRPTDIDDISWVEVRTDAGDDSYDLSYFKTLGLESNYREVRYEGSLSDYTVTLNNDGTVTVTHNSLSAGNTGTDTLTGAGDLIFVGDDYFRFNTEIRIDGDNIEGTLIGANLTDSLPNLPIYRAMTIHFWRLAAPTHLKPVPAATRCACRKHLSGRLTSRKLAPIGLLATISAIRRAVAEQPQRQTSNI